MEKRTIMAFVLSFLVLIVWTQLFTPQKDPVQKGSPALNEDVPRNIPPALKTDQPVEQVRLPDVIPQEQTPAIEEKTIEIQTPLYRALFSNIGPTIKSFQLKKFYQTIETDSPLIDLIHLADDPSDFFRMNFKSQFPMPSGKTAYEVTRSSLNIGPGSMPQEIVFSCRTSEGLVYSQVFRFYADQYKIDVTMDVTNTLDQPLEGVFSAAINAMPPKEKAGYYSYVGLALLLDGSLQEVELEDAPDQKDLNGRIEWMAYEDDYFISAVIPDDSVDGTFHGFLKKSGCLEGIHAGPRVSIAPGTQASALYSLYLGPRELKLLEATGSNLDKAVDFGWFDIIAKGLLFLLLFFNKFLNNYGLSIIVLTILIKILFWPLTHKSYKSMKEMQKLQPIMAKLREKYKNDKQKLNVEMMGLYKTYKVNPMGGCLPMLIQLPVFFALFRLLGGSIELRHAPFMLWINDLSAPDRLFSFSVDYLPLMHKPYGIPVLTLLMGASMFIQQKMTPTPGDPAQAKIMMLMPIIFTFMFINFPSGLVLYWLVNNILSIGQQYRILKSSV